MKLHTLLAGAFAAASLVASAAPAQAAQQQQNIDLVCGDHAFFSIVSPREQSVAALDENSNRVFILKGVNGTVHTGNPASQLITCQAFLDGEFFFNATVLVTPQGRKR